MKNYNLMVPTFEIKPFREMNKEEAKEHFEWYMNELPDRIKYLESLVGINLQYNEQSLIVIWKWFIDNFKKVKRSKDEIKEELERLKIFTNKVSKEKLSTESLAMVLDIGTYFGEMLIRNYDVLKWGFVTTPKRFADVNQPIVLGFRNKLILNPSRVVNTLGIEVLNGEKNKNALLDLYKVWLRMM